MAKEIFRIESPDRKIEAHQCLYPTPRLFIFTLDKTTGARTAFEQPLPMPTLDYIPSQPEPMSSRQPSPQSQIESEYAQTMDAVYNQISLLTQIAAKKPNPKNPNPNMPQEDIFEKAKKKRTIQRWE